MLRHLLLKPQQVNKFAVAGMLPLMVIVIMISTKGATATREPIESPRDGTLVIANLRAESVTIHSLAGDGQSRTLALESAPHELLAVDGRVYATLPRTGTIVEIDAHAPGVLRSTVAEPGVHGLTMDTDRLYASIDESQKVISIDLSTMQTLATHATGNTPHSIAAVGDVLYVTDTRDGLVRRIDSSTGEVRTEKAGKLPESLAVAGRYVAVADVVTGALTWYDHALRPLGTLRLERDPVRVIALDADRVAVALNGTARVAIVDLDLGEIEKTLSVAGHPDGLCLSPSGRFLAVVSNEHDSVNIFRTTDWRLMVTIGAGDGPGACAWF